jgi:peptide-methionine (S)-S-oxide reductase
MDTAKRLQACTQVWTCARIIEVIKMNFKAILVAGLMVVAPIAAHAKDVQKAVFAGGCFWCVESNFEYVDGVIEAVSGFSGGNTANPSYKSHGNHIEAVEVTYDADKVSYETLVDLFLRSSDVVDAGGQFCDRGRTYTSGIFASGENAKIAKAVISKHDASGKLPSPIVTPILSPSKFFAVDAYHQDYAKSKEKVLTRRGLMTKAKAYKFYRKGCGRDKRVKQLWGSQAFTGGH